MLERMEMENFKSFYGRHEVVFGPRLNCITGANGSGKSNILEAICFAFGESSCTRLRVSSLKELHSKPPSGQAAQVTTTRVTLFLHTRQNASMTISAALCGKSGHRSFRLNNRVMPIKNVKKHLRLECGINVDISLWLIQQNFVHKMPTRTSAEHAAFLCEAAGTKIFFDYREEALKEMENFRLSSQRIAENIRQLSIIVQRELAVIELHREQRELDREIEILKTKSNQLNRSLALARLDEARRDLDSVEKLHEECHAQQSLFRSEQECLEQKIQALRRNLSGSSELQLQYDQAQLDVVRVGTIREETSLLVMKLNEKITADISAQESTKSAIENLVHQRSNHQTALARAMAHNHCVAILREVHLSANMQNKTVRQVGAELSHLIEEIGREDDAQMQLRAQANVDEAKEEQTQLYSLQQSAAAVAAELDSKRQELKTKIHQLQDECEGWSESCVDDEIKTLRENAQKANDDLRRTLVNLPDSHGTIEIEGYFGILMNLVEVRDLTRQEEKHWIAPLGVLLQKSLSNRICADTTVAKRIIVANANRHSFIIWPVKSMEVPPRKLDRVLSAVYKKFGKEDVADPLDLVTVSSGVPDDLRTSVMLCLRKALGSWLLVKSDAIGERVLQEFGIPCVSTNLNMHSPGVLAGGYHSESTAFQAFIHLPAVRSRCHEIQGQLSKMKDLQAKMAGLSGAESELKRLQVTISKHHDDMKRYETRIRELQNRLDLCEQEKRTLQNGAIRRHVLRQGLSRYQEMVVHEGSLINPDERFQDQDNEINRTKHKLNAIDAEITSLESDGVRIAEDIRAAKTRVFELEQRNCLVEGDWQKSSKQVRTLAAGLKQHEEARESISEMEASHRMLFEQLKDVEERIARLDAEKADLVEHIQNIESKVCSTADEDNDVDMESGNCTAEQIRKQLAEVQTRLGSCNLRRKIIIEELKSAPYVVEENVLFKQSKLARFQTQAHQVEIALSHLEEGIQSTELRSQYANEVTFHRVNRCLGEIFSRLVPSKSAALIPIDPLKLEMGVSFNVQGRAAEPQTVSAAKKTKEMSGGQLAMLGMAYVFALAHHSASPLYVLDEVDAALDEHNQRLVAELVVEYFNRSQVICISHHQAFHRKAAHLIEVQKVDGASQVKTRSTGKR